MTKPLAGKHILIVEDEPVFRSLLDSWLSRWGNHCPAEDGVDAFENGQYHARSDDSDIAMPRMNGLKLVEHLRNEATRRPYW